MKSVRVCHVVDSLQPHDVSRVAAAVATGLPRESFGAEVVARRSGLLAQVCADAGVPVSIVGGSRREPFSAAWTAYRRIVAARPTVVHLWDDWAVRYVGPLLARSGSVPYVCARRELPRGFHPWRRRVERYVLRRAAAVVANDEFTAERCWTVCGLNGGHHWNVVTDGLLPPLTPPADRATVLAELGLPPDAPLFGTFVPSGGAFDAKDVVWVGALLRNLYEDLRLILVTDDDDLAPLRRFGCAMDYDDRAVFVIDPAQFERLAPHWLFYVDANYWTGPTHATLAAQAAGVPVIAVDTPIRRRLIDVDRGGYLAPRHDREQITRHAYRLLRDETLRTTLGAAGREFVAARLPLQAMLDGYADVYRRIIH